MHLTNNSWKRGACLSLRRASLVAAALLLAGTALAGSHEMGPMPPRGFAQGKVVLVDGVKGKDTPQCGKQKPCKTINQGVTRARQIQDDPVAADEPGVSNIAQGLENLVTVQVAPGTYNEAVLVTHPWIRLLGAGPGSSIITTGTTPVSENFWDNVALLIRGPQPVWVEGFTFADSRHGIALRTGAQVFVTDCAFDGNESGINVGFSSYAYVSLSNFSDNNSAARVVQDSHLSLQDVAISRAGAASGFGVLVSGRSGADLSPVEGTLSNQISNMSFGVYVGQGSNVEISGMEITENRFGIYVEENSFVRTFGGEVTDNDVFGVFFDAFSNGVLDAATDISGNGTDTDTDATSSFVVR